MKLTPHFSWNEMTTTSHSDLRDVNREEAKNYACAIYLTACMMETVRAIIGRPIRVTSGFRSQPLNSRVKGSVKSQHCKGEACDWQPIGGSLEEAFEKLVKEVLILTFKEIGITLLLRGKNVMIRRFVKFVVAAAAIRKMKKQNKENKNEFKRSKERNTI